MLFFLLILTLKSLTILFWTNFKWNLKIYIYDQSVEINHYPNSPYLPNHTYRILIIDDSESGKTNVLLNLIKNQRPYTDNIYSNVKDLFESKYQLFVDRREKVGIKKLKHSKAFIDYSEIINNVYENLEDYIQ